MDHPPDRLASVHRVARITLAIVYLWHGLVPKLLFHHPDELALLRDAGLSAAAAARTVEIVGVAEVGFALVLLVAWRVRALFLLSTVAMLAITPVIIIHSPRFIPAAFTPVTFNLCVAALGLVGWLASARPKHELG